MKIVFIAVREMPFGGGIEKCAEEIGSRLVKAGHEVIVYSLMKDEVNDRKYLGMTIKKVPCLHFRALEKITGTIAATILQFKEREVDIIHFHGFSSLVLPFITKAGRRKSILHGQGIEWKRSRWNGLVRFFLFLIGAVSMRTADKIIVASRVQQNFILERFGRESTYIPNGVNRPNICKPNLINELGLKGNDYIFFAARLVREKGAHYLIKAFKRLKTDLKLVISGDADYESGYKKELYKLAEGEKNILFTGLVKDRMLEELFSNSFIFVLPSEIEGLSIALLEAMSYGSCCLVSDIPENLEAINNRGYSFRTRDTEDLRKKMQYLIDNKDRVESMKNTAADFVLSNYSWDNIANQIEKTYKYCLAGGSKERE